MTSKEDVQIALIICAMIVALVMIFASCEVGLEREKTNQLTHPTQSTNWNEVPESLRHNP